MLHGGIMTNHNSDRLPIFYARTTGLLFLGMLVFAIVGMMYVPYVLFVPGDAAVTAGNIQASPWLYRLGILCELFVFLIEVAIIAMLYLLFRPVSKPLALIAAFSRLVMAAIQGVNLINLSMPGLLLGGAGYLTVFEPEQIQALVLLFLNAHGYGVNVWTVFFAFHCCVLAALILKSGYIPKVFAPLMFFAFLGYMMDGFGSVLFPAHKETYAVIVSVTAFAGELPFFIWLLFKGVSLEEWKKRVSHG